MKYENFSLKKLQKLLFFCTFVPDLAFLCPKNVENYVQLLIT